ncbi:MAG TPA: alpha/beta hydrolase [Pyrinomonadaceae bacterium]
MSQETTPEEIVKKEVVYRIPGMNEVKVTRDVEYRATDEGALTMDIYYPPDSSGGERPPAVVFVAGYPDPGFEKMLGCKFKEMGASVSWARLTAASGLVAVTYTNREPAADARALLEHVRQHADTLGIDGQRIGLWACSGSVPLALLVLMSEAGLKCAALSYGFMLDSEGATHVAEAARKWGFANPCAGKSTADLLRDVPLFIARAGQDRMPHLNETVDDFAAGALAQNLPVTLVNHPTAPHAFDLFDDTDASREIIRRILAFMRFHLLGAP